MLAVAVGAAAMPGVATAPVAAWGGLLVAANVLRLVLARAYHRQDRPSPRLWSGLYAAPLALTGLLWGLSVPWFGVDMPPMLQAALVIVIAGVSAGGMPMNAPVLPNYLLFLAGCVLPVAVTYLWLGHTESGTTGQTVLGAVTLVYLASMVTAARRHSADQRHGYAQSARLEAANRDLAHRVSHDALTGLWNRERFEAEVDREFGRSVRYGSTFGLVMIDVDAFKAVNDRYGHEVGDRVLQQLATLLQACAREPDQLARWGGEEFMLLLPETDLDGAVDAAERMRRSVAAGIFDGPGRMTVSCGVTACSGRTSRSAVFKRADDALYAAKQAGRDRVESVAAA